MPKLLREPKLSQILDRVRIAAFKVEDNIFQGQRWIEVWVVLGRLEGEEFRQYVDPETGAEIFRYLKLEDGMHPLAPGRALTKCDECGVWGTLRGGCQEDGCAGTMAGYDGARRFVLTEHQGPLTYVGFKQALYQFLAGEEVPDPITGELVTLLDIQES